MRRMARAERGREMAEHGIIRSYSDYRRFVAADKKASGIQCKYPALSGNIMVLLTDPCWKFQLLLRKLEYWTNCKKTKKGFPLSTLYNAAYLYILRKRFQKMSVALGFSILINVFDEGLCIGHFGSIVVSRHAKIGKNCEISSCVNIGGTAQRTATTIGDNCFIGPGVKIISDVEIGDNVKIGANAVVNKSFPEGNVTIAGIPAKIVRSGK